MAEYDVFHGLNKAEIKTITDMGAIRTVEGGKLLFRKGDIGHEMYIMLTGKIQIIDEYETHKKVLAELGTGELFGEMAMFGQHARSAHALAKEHSQILVLSEEVLTKLLERKVPKKFLTNIITILCHRLRITNNLFMRAKYGEAFPKEVEKWLG